MYRFTPSAQPVSNPLQGLIGLGAVTSYYRTPVYSCTQNSAVVELATKLCASRPSTKHVDYKRGYSKEMTGTSINPYQITVKDIYSSFFDVCRVKRVKLCSAKKPPQPVVVDSPDDLIQLPPPAPHAAPVRPSTVEVLVPTTAPTPPTIVASETTPVTVWTPPPKSPLTADMVSAITPTKIVEYSPQETIDIERPPPEEDSGYGKYLVGGILLLVAGGGMAYYMTRKKRK